MEAIGEAKVEWMTSSDIQASDEEVFNYTTVLPIKGKHKCNPNSFNFWFNWRCSSCLSTARMVQMKINLSSKVLPIKGLTE